MSQGHVFGAKVIVALVLGALVGYAVGNSLANDAERGRTLTLKQYVADFDSYKEELASSNTPMGAAVVIGMIMVATVFGVYELLAFGLGKALAAIGGRGASGAPPAGLPPPPWELGRR